MSADADVDEEAGKHVSLASSASGHHRGGDAAVSIEAPASSSAPAHGSASRASRPPPVPVPGRANGSKAAGPEGFAASAEGQYRTLDEPVSETIMRDLRSIGQKIGHVMMPRNRQERVSRLRDWDLWGPLLLCLALGFTIAYQAPDNDQASYAFADVFCIVWVGSAVVTLNALLLRGKVSFFQSVCVLGYCMCPLVLASIVVMILPNVWLKVIVVSAGIFWATGASVGFIAELVPEDRKALGVFPVWLFYIAIAWMILLA